MDTRQAVRNGLGVGFSIGLSGLAFGSVAVAAGLSAWQAFLLSVLALSGSAQFALVGVIAGGGNLVAGTASAVVLTLRNSLYGLRLARTLEPSGWLRLPLTANFVMDETTAVATAQPDDRTARAGFWATGLSISATWNVTTLIGGLGAARLGNPDTYGLDVVGPAAFLALLWPRLAGRVERHVAVAAAVVAVATTPLLPPGVPVLLAALAALSGARR